MKRLSHDDYFMSLAYMCSLRSTCTRRSVGAIIVDANNHILSTGYNGVPKGSTHCIDAPCAGADMESGAGLDDCEAIHAEANAVTHCSSLVDAYKLYTTTMPCVSCMKLLLATPIAVIVYGESYSQPKSMGMWLSAFRGLQKHESTTPLYTAIRMAATNRITQSEGRKAISD